MSRWFVSYGFAEVYPRLVIGAYPLDAGDVEMLASMAVSRVLNLVQDEEYETGERATVESAYAAAGISERRMKLVDYGRIPAHQLERAVTAVNGWLNAGGGISYLHCRAGWQRSAAVAAGVVAIRKQLGIDEALADVQRHKPTAEPLPHQVEDLHAWWDARGGANGQSFSSQPN